jgi:DNA polymerase
VHDEIVAEVPDGFGSVEEFVAILTTPPDWAAGLPIAAKGVRRDKAALSSGCKSHPAKRSSRKQPEQLRR